MTPVNIHHHQRRALSRSISFTIIFTLTAGLVVVLVLVSGFVVHCLRKRRLQQRTTNEHARSTSDITSYDPRHESPFLNVARPDSIVLPTWTPIRARSPAMGTNQSLVTPIRQDSPYPFLRPTLPRVGARSHQPPTRAAWVTDFGDAREYILAVPEPLRVSSRTLCHQATTASPLRTLPASIEISALAKKHMHAKSSFERLHARDTEGSEGSSTSLKVHEPVDHGKGSIAKIYTTENASDEEVMDLRLSFRFPENKGNQLSKTDDGDVQDTSPVISTQEGTDVVRHNASVAAMHRLRTYRSLVGAPPPEPLSRAGTLTRPKTPVATIRDIYDPKPDNGKAMRKTISRNDTISTLFRTATGSSDGNSPQSPATSPLKASPEQPKTSSLSLVPTPLRIRGSSEVRSVSSPTKRTSKFKEQLHHADGLCATMGGEKIGASREPIVSSSSTRPRPAPLTLAANARLPLSQQSPLLASSPIGAKLMPPQHRSHIPSMQASSIYSYDTLGHRMERTPVTPDFPNTGVLRSQPFAPYVPSTIGETNESSDKGTEANLITARERGGNPRTIIDTANQKVENWKVDDMDWDFDTSPLSLKRTIPTIGRDVESHEASEIGEEKGDEKSLYSTISTDINPVEARLSVVVGSPLRTSGCDSVVGAPEGGNWL